MRGLRGWTWRVLFVHRSWCKFVSRLEQRADMYVSTLRSYPKATGADLQVKAVFPNGEVEIDQFEEIQAKRKSA